MCLGPFALHLPWVLEVASTATMAQDLGLKREFYRYLGVQEYWLYSPEGPLPDQPSSLRGWLRKGDHWRAVPLAYAPDPGVWYGLSYLWQHEICAPDPDPDALWDQDYLGLYFRDPDTGRITFSYQEQIARLQEQQATLQEQQATIQEQQATIQEQQDRLNTLHTEQQKTLVLLMALQSGDIWAERLRQTLTEVDPVQYPTTAQMQTWLHQHPTGQACLNTVRAALGLEP